MRNNLLEMAWTGPPLMIGGRELVLTWGRYELLGAWKNPLFHKPDPDDHDDKPNRISEPCAMGEILLTCSSTIEEIKQLRAMTAKERAGAVLNYMLEHEEEIGDAAIGIQQRIQSIEAAGVEIDDMGKPKAGEGPRHAD